jgi:serine/threonine protein kinase
MDIYCTRLNCPAPRNYFSTLTVTSLKTAPLQFCKTCTMPLLLGGHYLPLEKIAGGILGSTFLAEDLHSVSGKRYVVKLLPAKKHLTPEQLQQVKQRFRQEAKILETLGSEHQQIPSLSAHFELTVLGFSGTKLQSDQTEELFYLVEEYIDGQTLAEELAQRGEFRETEAIAILRQILPILQFIHGHDYGVVHEAIRPEHIIRDRKGRLHLTNFGAVKQVIGASAGQNSIGSALLFDPPEQRSGQLASPASDLYALAVTMLRLLTHQDLTTLFEPETQSWHWRPYAQVSDRLGNIFDKMLQFTPEQRFQSAAEVMAALNRMSTGLQLNPTQPLQVATEAIQSLESAWEQDHVQYSNGLQTNGRLQANGKLQTEVEPLVEQIKILSKLNLPQPAIDQPKPFESRLASSPESEVQQIDFESNAVSRPRETSPQNLLSYRGTTYRAAPNGSTPEETLPRNIDTKQRKSNQSHITNESSTVAPPDENFRIAQVLRRSAILGSGGWFTVAALASFLGTVLASGLWMLVLTVVIFGLLARGQSLSEKLRLLIIAIASAGLTFLLVPQFFRMFSLAQALPQLLLLALASGLFAMILIVSSQMAYDSMSKK